MQYRHEWKIEIDRMDARLLRNRLRAVASIDPHSAEGSYRVRSLYFDTPSDRALREKLDGVDRRDKFRIRCYNEDLSLIRLEKKSKRGGLCAKSSCALTQQQALALSRGSAQLPDEGAPALLQELLSRMRSERLRPATIVEYTREPFVYAPGNVRVTIDRDIRTGLRCTEFLDFDRPTVPVQGDPILLEVKWDEFLPSIIRDAVQLRGRRAQAYSKYAACRVYG
ncbi:MAG: polyphosphate polymerase domain-containing protein [Eubacteriales bacterium]|nr:polyphosphate polymerase domain-containing protein [Eubacteriales bacterium]